jgi:hypothetical protein
MIATHGGDIPAADDLNYLVLLRAAPDQIPGTEDVIYLVIMIQLV